MKLIRGQSDCKNIQRPWWVSRQLEALLYDYTWNWKGKGIKYCNANKETKGTKEYYDGNMGLQPKVWSLGFQMGNVGTNIKYVFIFVDLGNALVEGRENVLS